MDIIHYKSHSFLKRPDCGGPAGLLKSPFLWENYILLYACTLPLSLIFLQSLLGWMILHGTERRRDLDTWHLIVSLLSLPLQQMSSALPYYIVFLFYICPDACSYTNQIPDLYCLQCMGKQLISFSCLKEFMLWGLIRHVKCMWGNEGCGRIN